MQGLMIGDLETKLREHLRGHNMCGTETCWVFVNTFGCLKNCL